jgi:hypothetical protein
MRPGDIRGDFRTIGSRIERVRIPTTALDIIASVVLAAACVGALACLIVGALI